MLSNFFGVVLTDNKLLVRIINLKFVLFYKALVRWWKRKTTRSIGKAKSFLCVRCVCRIVIWMFLVLGRFRNSSSVIKGFNTWHFYPNTTCLFSHCFSIKRTKQHARPATTSKSSFVFRKFVFLKEKKKSFSEVQAVATKRIELKMISFVKFSWRLF